MARRDKKDNYSEKSDAQMKEASVVQKWLMRIDHSKRYKKTASERYHWTGLTEKYRGYFAGLQDSSDIYVPALNYIFAFVKAEIPRLALRDPKISINPKKGSSILSAKILQKAINYLWRTKKIKRENKKNLLDSLLVGHSWFKTGYTGKFGTIEDANGRQYEFVESEDFFGYRVPYDNVFFSPESNDPPYDCKWIAHEVWMSLDEVQENKEFKHTAELSPSIKDEGNVGDRDPMDSLRRFGPDDRMIKMYEVWDKMKGQTFIITEGCEYYIQAPKEWPYEMRGFPFSFLRLNDDPWCPYGLPDTYMFEPQVLELIKIRAQEIDHIKRFNRQLLLAEGHMTQDAKDQFSQGITGAVLEVQANGRPIGDIVTPIPYPSIQTDIYAIEDRIQQDMTRTNGQTITEQGGVQKTATRSLGELNTMNEGASNRREDKIDTIEDFIEDIASNLVALLQQFADMPFYVSVVGDEDMETFMQEVQNRPSAKAKGAVTAASGFTFTKEDIQGEFDFEVVPGSTKPFDSAQKLQTMMQILDSLPKLGIQPGPVTQYLGTEIASELDMTGFQKAVQDEIEMAKQRMAAAEKQQDQQMQLMAAQNAADIQIKAEREATKQQELQLRAAELFNLHGGNTKEAPKEDKGPSESISFKDLPPEGQVQMARQAGINISAESAKAHMEAQKSKPPLGKPDGK
jgi:hypothetical protein